MNSDWQAFFVGLAVGIFVSVLIGIATITRACNGAWERAAVARGFGHYTTRGMFYWDGTTPKEATP